MPGQGRCYREGRGREGVRGESVAWIVPEPLFASPEWFLGLQGKKVTLTRAAPETPSSSAPRETRLRCRVPPLELEEKGGFPGLYDMRQVRERDCYGKNPYGAYKYADQPLETIENLDATGGPHVLVVHDSRGRAERRRDRPS